MESLQQRFQRLCETPSDINQHLPTLADYAKRCRHVTEFGVREAVSTTAWLWGLQGIAGGTLVCYDLNDSTGLQSLMHMDLAGVSFEFRRIDALAAMIDPTDLLFIDTIHSYGQLKAELYQHAELVRRWIVLHDTESFRAHDEGGNGKGCGLWPAVEEFVAEGAFELSDHFSFNNGLTILERRRAA